MTGKYGKTDAAEKDKLKEIWCVWDKFRSSTKNKICMEQHKFLQYYDHYIRSKFPNQMYCQSKIR